MSFETYTDLTAALAGWMKRKDQQARIPDFIRLFEARVNRVLRTGYQRQTASIGVYGGAVQLPDDYLELVTSDDGTKGLRFLTSGQYGVSQDWDGRYAIEGRTLRISGDTGTINVRYYAKIPPLGTDNPTNWLLADHPDAYLFGALTEAEPYLLNDARMAMWKDRGDTAVQAIQLADDQARFSGDTLQLRAPR